MSNRGIVSGGSLREIVSFQSLGSTRDSFGENIHEWTTYASNVRASVRPLSMRERFAGDQVLANIDKQVVIRYSSSVQPTDRMIWESEEYDIKSIIDFDERKHKVTLLVKRVAT